MSEASDSKPPEQDPPPLSIPAPSAAPTSPPSNSERSFCTKCGYALAGLPAEGVCPECKTSFRGLPEGATVPDGFLCYKCGYGLVGLPADGDCPECSTPYALALAFRGKPHPGQSVLALRLFWPIGVGILAFLGLMVMGFGRGPGGDLSGFFGLCMVGAILVNLINLPIASSSLSAKYVPPHKRRRWSANMFFLGPWVGTAWVLATIIAVITVGLPVVAFGACVLSGVGGFR